MSLQLDEEERLSAVITCESRESGSHSVSEHVSSFGRCIVSNGGQMAGGTRRGATHRFLALNI